MPRLRLIYAGTPAFAVVPLAAILEAGHEVALVLTQPDRPSGRGLHPAPSPVKRFALEHGLHVAQPNTLKSEAGRAPLVTANAQLMIVVAYGLILPQAVLDLPPLGALNIHASLLPRWRGAAPIQRAIEAGDAMTGVCIMQLDAGLDTGPIVAERAIPIEANDTSGTLHERLATLGAEMIVAVLDGAVRSGSIASHPQPAEGATYAAKISKAEEPLDWRRPAVELARRVRAFDPVPGTRLSVRGHDIKVWRARVLDASASTAPPGTLVRIDSEGPVIACHPGLLRLETLQRAGARRLAAPEVVRGLALAPGDRCDGSAT